jgi:hypothetical protein
MRWFVRVLRVDEQDAILLVKQKHTRSDTEDGSFGRDGRHLGRVLIISATMWWDIDGVGGSVAVAGPDVIDH